MKESAAMSAGIKLRKIYRAGYCVSRGALAQKTLSWKKVRFYARAFLLEHHKRGLILIDTGYGEAALKSLSKGINRLYSALLPIVYRPEDSLIFQLKQDGIAPQDLSYLILTHFHPDHIGALPEFTQTRWIYREPALRTLLAMNRWNQLQNGFLPDLIPSIPPNSIPLSNFEHQWNKFPSSDIFSDGSLHLIDLPGHALGQMGVATKKQLFAADALWSTEAPPHPISYWLQQDSKAYRRTFAALQNLPLQIIPTHTIEPYV